MEDEFLFDFVLFVKNKISDQVNTIYKKQFHKYGWSLDDVSTYLGQGRIETRHINKDDIEWSLDGKPIFIEHREYSSVIERHDHFTYNACIWFQDIKDKREASPLGSD